MLTNILGLQRQDWILSGLKPKDIQTLKDLEKLPITKKTDLIDLQKKNPPFGGFEASPDSTS